MKFFMATHDIEPDITGVYVCPYCQAKVFGVPGVDYIVCVPKLAHAQFDKDRNLLNGNPAARSRKDANS